MSLYVNETVLKTTFDNWNIPLLNFKEDKIYS